MKITAQIEDGPNKQKRYLVELSEVEIDKITGIAGTPHNPARYKAGQSIDISRIYNKVKQIVENNAAIRLSMQQMKIKAKEIEDSLQLTE